MLVRSVTAVSDVAAVFAIVPVVFPTAGATIATLSVSLQLAPSSLLYIMLYPLAVQCAQIVLLPAVLYVVLAVTCVPPVCAVNQPSKL